MKIQVVLGALFGDEGKGSTVQWLCQRALSKGERPLVVRFSGGPQAGHRVVAPSPLSPKGAAVAHVCSSFGSGVLVGVPTFLDSHVLVDPISLKLEYDDLQRKGISVPLLFISQLCRVITPYDVWANLNSDTILGHGSCGKGIFTTVKRYDAEAKAGTGRPLLRAGSLADSSAMLQQAADYYREQWGDDFERLEEYEDMFYEACRWVNEHVNLNANLHPDLGTSEKGKSVQLTDYDVVIFEGSQGLLLDEDCGFMPWCTPSHTGLTNLMPYLQQHGSAGGGAEVYLVMRSYLTRHGAGYEPAGADTLLREYHHLDEAANGDDGTQGRFKRGLFSVDLLRRAIDRHCLDNAQHHTGFRAYVVMTHLDCCPDGEFSIIDNGGVRRTVVSDLLRTVRTSCGLRVDGVYGSGSPMLSEQQFVVK